MQIKHNNIILNKCDTHMRDLDFAYFFIKLIRQFYFSNQIDEMSSCEPESYNFILFDKTLSKLFTGLHESKLFFNMCLFKMFLQTRHSKTIYVFVIQSSKEMKYYMFGRTCEIKRKMYRPGLSLTRVPVWDSAHQSGAKC